LQPSAHQHDELITWTGEGPAERKFARLPLRRPDFVRTVGLTILQGRDFSRSRPADAENFLINETARREMGLEDPVGVELRFWQQRGQVIGVVGDFTNRHMSSATAPVILTTGWGGQDRNYLLLKLRPGNPAGALRHFQEVWEKANPGFPCEYGFLDEAFDRMYTNEQRLSGILSSFTALAVLISCLRLVGLPPTPGKLGDRHPQGAVLRREDDSLC
jgi:hypothetical protein